MGKYLSLCPKRGKNKKIYGQRLGKYQIRNGGHFFSFPALARKKERPDCDEAQKLVAAWQRHITEHYYDCSTEMLAGLGQMYQQDPRFSENLEQYGKDCSEFASQAIHVYCQKK